MIWIAQGLHGLESNEIQVLPNKQSLRSHIPRGDPQGVTGHPIIFHVHTQHMKGDAQWLLSKPADEAGGEVTDVERCGSLTSRARVFRQPEPCAKQTGMQLPLWRENTYLGKQRKSGKDAGGKVGVQPNLCVTLQSDKGEERTCRLKHGPVLVPQRVLNRKTVCPLLVSAF